MINIVIPMSGKGSRFVSAGYKLPKPLIDVCGKPMIQQVVENLDIPLLAEDGDVQVIFLVLKDHYDQYLLKYLLPLIITPAKCKIVVVEQVTEGAACTVLLAKEFINNDDPLIIVNSDQIIDWKGFGWFLDSFLISSPQKNDGSIVTFKANDPKWSYVKLDNLNKVLEIAEKKVISNYATVGIYGFRNGSDFVWAAEEMIKKDIRTNGEFYVAPAINELIGIGKDFISFPAEKMYGLGTPEDLQHYLSLNTSS